MKIVAVAMFMSFIVSAVIAYAMMQVHIDRINKTNEEYRQKIMDSVTDTVVNTIEGMIEEIKKSKEKVEKDDL